MPIRTAADFLESLKDGRDISIEGERVKDIAADPRFAGAARAMAHLMEMQHDPALTDLMTAVPLMFLYESGIWVSRLVARRRADTAASAGESG